MEFREDLDLGQELQGKVFALQKDCTQLCWDACQPLVSNELTFKKLWRKIDNRILTCQQKFRCQKATLSGIFALLVCP